jgi:hypothetical protein
MREIVVRVGLLCVVFGCGSWLGAQQRPLVVEQSSYSIHLLLHKIGTETYTVTETGAGQVDGRLEMTTTSTSSDRGMKRVVTSKLENGR